MFRTSIKPMETAAQKELFGRQQLVERFVPEGGYNIQTMVCYTGEAFTVFVYYIDGATGERKRVSAAFKMTDSTTEDSAV